MICEWTLARQFSKGEELLMGFSPLFPVGHGLASEVR
jgi:hypothetical protein